MPKDPRSHAFIINQLWKTSAFAIITEKFCRSALSHKKVKNKWGRYGKRAFKVIVALQWQSFLLIKGNLDFIYRQPITIVDKKHKHGKIVKSSKYRVVLCILAAAKQSFDHFWQINFCIHETCYKSSSDMLPLLIFW
jgi:hypothetical protein